jgi:hypothetical protein
MIYTDVRRNVIKKSPMLSPKVLQQFSFKVVAKVDQVESVAKQQSKAI